MELRPQDGGRGEHLVVARGDKPRVLRLLRENSRYYGQKVVANLSVCSQRSVVRKHNFKGIDVMKLALILATAASIVGLSVSTAATAGTLLSDNFSGENGGVTQENYTGFANFTLLQGSVDLIHTGDVFGLNCGASSACVDLDGSTDMGGILSSTASFNFEANKQVTLTVDVSGNQRSAAADADDALILGFYTVGPDEITSFTSAGPGDFSGDGGSFAADPTGTGFGAVSDPIPFDQGFEAYSVSFTAAESGTFQLTIGTFSADDIGPIVNQVTLSAAPEPSIWTLMIAGVGMAGAAFRFGRRSGSPAIG